MTPTTIPVNVTPEAAERIAERGLQMSIDQMIEQAVKMVPGIRRVEISLEGPYDTHYEQYLHAIAFRDPELFRLDIPEEDRFSRWIVEEFSPDIRWQVQLHIHCDAPHAR